MGGSRVFILFSAFLSSNFPDFFLIFVYLNLYDISSIFISIII